MAKTVSTLPKPRQIRIRVVEEKVLATGGFLTLRRTKLQNHYSRTQRSSAYAYDFVERSALDAVAIVLEKRVRGRSYLCVRSSLRPPLMMRPRYAIPLRERTGVAVQWEVPAGLVEEIERGVLGLQRCAARETEEEVGFRLSPKRFAMLGHGVTLSPGVIGEKIYFLHAELSDDAIEAPAGDGSAVEENAQVLFVPLDEALRAVDGGRIADVKTEIAIRRLHAVRSVSRATPRAGKARRS